MNSERKREKDWEKRSIMILPKMEGGRVGFATTINKNQWMGWVRPYGLEHMDIELVGEADVLNLHNNICQNLDKRIDAIVVSFALFCISLVFSFQCFHSFSGVWWIQICNK